MLVLLVVLATIKVPIRANIEPARWAEKLVNGTTGTGTGDSGHCGNLALIPNGAIAVGENSNSVYDYVWVYNTNVGHSHNKFTTAHRSIFQRLVLIRLNSQ